MNKLIRCVVVFGFLFFQISFAGGLSTKWGELYIDSLAIGNTYRISQLVKDTFKIENDFDTDIGLETKVTVPTPKELKPGYEQIPDTNWVKLVKTKNIAPAKGYAVLDFEIIIPKDKIHLGKKYQFWVWTYTTGGAVGVGLRSRFLISISNTSAKVKEK